MVSEQLVAVLGYDAAGVVWQLHDSSAVCALESLGVVVYTDVAAPVAPWQACNLANVGAGGWAAATNGVEWELFRGPDASPDIQSAFRSRVADNLLAASAASVGTVRKHLERVCGLGLSAMRDSLRAAGVPPADVSRTATTLNLRVLFVLMAESRGLLPPPSPLYPNLHAVVRRALGDTGYNPWPDLKALFGVLRTGNAAVRRRPAPLFEELACEALEVLPGVTSWLTGLACTPGGALVPFNVLAPRDVGDMYEGLHHVCSSSRKADVQLAKGTFYTPAPPARLVVRATLRPFVAAAMGSSASWEEALAALLRLRVVDPAAGAAHFLLDVVDVLTDAVVGRALADAGLPGCPPPGGGLPSVAAVRVALLSHVVHGVDSDPTAVDLARCALELAATRAGSLPPGVDTSPLAAVQRNVRLGNSFVGCVGPPLGSPLWRVVVDACLGDGGLAQATQTAVAAGDAWPSTRLYRNLAVVCDMACSPEHDFGRHAQTKKTMAALRTLFACEDDAAWGGLRRQLLPLVDLGHGFACEAPFQSTFHWWLDLLPWVPPGEPLFHAVVGNPPWNLLEVPCPRTPADHAQRAVCAREAAYVHRSGQLPVAAASSGKIQLYNVFLERGLQLLGPGGRLGIITQNAVVSGVNATKLREHVVTHTSVEFVVEFAAKRLVFPTVNKGVALLVMEKRGARAPPGAHPATMKVYVPALAGGGREVVVAAAMGGVFPPRRTLWGTSGLKFLLPTRSLGCERLDRLVCGLPVPRLGGTLSAFADTRQGDFNSTSRRSALVAADAAGAVGYIKGSCVRAFGRLEGVVGYVKLPPRGGGAVVMQEVADLNKRRKFSATLIPPHTLANHSTVVLCPTKALLRQRAFGGCPPGAALLFLCGLLNSRFLEAVLRCRERSDHVSVMAVRALPAPDLSAVPALGGARRVDVAALGELPDRPAVWAALGGDHVGRVQHVHAVIDTVVLALGAAALSPGLEWVLDAAVCRVFGCSEEEWEAVWAAVEPVTACPAVPATARPWPPDATLDAWRAELLTL